MNKKILVVVSLLILSSIITAFVITYPRNSESGLDNFVIEGLTSDDMINIERNEVKNAKSVYEKGTSSGAPNASRYEDSDRVQFTCDEISGIKTVSVTKAENCELTFTVNSTLYSGKAKIIVIRDDKIVERLDFNESKAVTFSVLGESIFKVKILCESAKLDVEVLRQISD